jgi:hypothetical protein
MEASRLEAGYDSHRNFGEGGSNILGPAESLGGQQANEGRKVIVSHALVFGAGQTTAQGLEQGKLSVARVDCEAHVLVHVLGGKLRGKIVRLELGLLETRQPRVGDVLGQHLKVEIVADAGACICPAMLRFMASFRVAA